MNMVKKIIVLNQNKRTFIRTFNKLCVFPFMLDVRTIGVVFVWPIVSLRRQERIQGKDFLCIPSHRNKVAHGTSPIFNKHIFLFIFLYFQKAENLK